MTKKIEYKLGEKLIGHSKLTFLFETNDRKTKNYRRYGFFICECGGIVEACIHHVKRGDTRSCGCLAQAVRKTNNRKHGESDSREYSSWLNMIYRCTKKDYPNYEYYGGRGISVCDEWSLANPDGFKNFLRDMGNKPSKDHSIDRVDVNLGYCKDNCKWSSKSEQSYNRREHSNNKTGVTGVSYHHNRYSVVISKNCKNHYIGKFLYFEDAVRARLQAEIDLYGSIKDVNKKWEHLLGGE